MDTDEHHETLTGRKAVRALLIEPLEADGLRRKRGVSLEEHKEFLTKIADKLSYCDRHTLERLRPMILAMAGGEAADVWPSFATIQNHAHYMEAPPDKSDEILYGWLHSRAGEACQKHGTLLATRLYIKKMRRPPVAAKGGSGGFALNQVRNDQREIDFEMTRLQRLRSTGEAKPSELETLDRHETQLAELKAIVLSGIRYREAKAAEVDA